MGGTIVMENIVKKYCNWREAKKWASGVGVGGLLPEVVLEFLALGTA